MSKHDPKCVLHLTKMTIEYGLHAPPSSGIVANKVAAKGITRELYYDW